MISMRKTLIGLASATSLLLACFVSAGPASSAVDTTPPSLNTPIKSSFLVGSRLDGDFVPDCGSHVAGDGQVWVSAYQTFKWTGSDNSGSVRYSWLEQTKGEGEGASGELGTTAALTDYTTNSNQECGGGSWMTSSWDITATDPSGNSVTKSVTGGLFTFTQDNNTYDDSFYAVKSKIAYAGAWATAKCACWSDGAVHKTTAKNASAKITFEQATGTSPTHVALVMHKGPDRGKFKVLVNGVLKTTVDLYAAASTPRIIVWQASVNKSDTVKVVNLATAGRTRIDLDGVLTN